MDILTFRIIVQLFVAVFLGLAIGFEREYRGKPAGLRTYGLVALGAALFTIISVEGFGSGGAFDPSRIASQVVVGVGFIGAGIIFVQGGSVHGLTTAAGLWTAAAIGMAVGIGFYAVAIYATSLTIIILWAIRKLEGRMIRSKDFNSQKG